MQQNKQQTHKNMWSTLKPADSNSTIKTTMQILQNNENSDDLNQRITNYNWDQSTNLLNDLSNPNYQYPTAKH